MKATGGLRNSFSYCKWAAQSVCPKCLQRDAYFNESCALQWEYILHISIRTKHHTSDQTLADLTDARLMLMLDHFMLWMRSWFDNHKEPGYVAIDRGHICIDPCILSLNRPPVSPFLTRAHIHTLSCQDGYRFKGKELLNDLARWSGDIQSNFIHHWYSHAALRKCLGICYPHHSHTHAHTIEIVTLAWDIKNNAGDYVLILGLIYS